MFAAVMEQRPQLMASAAAGNADSFAVLIEPLLDPAYRLAAVMLADRSSAEDAVQLKLPSGRRDHQPCRGPR
jgi:DNA-directed RNA polymerase specialized sigma24 family protein